MLQRVLEPEVMDTAEDAHDYDTMDHSGVNRVFVLDLLQFAPRLQNPVLDVGTGTAQIPIELCQQHTTVQVMAIDAAATMIELANRNIANAGLTSRIRAELVNARGLPFPDQHFAAVISNSIIHHIPEPMIVFTEMVRVGQRDGVIFVRDLFRPDDEATLTHLVQTYAGDANAHQRMLFADSLRAALTVDEVRGLVTQLGYAAETVNATSDRHWTWAATIL